MIYAPTPFGTAAAKVRLKRITAITITVLNVIVIIRFTLEWAAGQQISFPILGLAVIGLLGTIKYFLEWAFNPKGS